jgi:pimeloyl-ACP methyl ester carboxylesterase
MTDIIDPFPGPTSHIFKSQRLRLNYLDWGNRSAPLLVLVHGGRDHSRSWDWTARALRHDWHVVAPDLRGHGDSAWSPEGNYSFSAYLYDLAQLLHQLGDGPATIVAHSLGATIALRYAGIYPQRVRRLVAIEGNTLLAPSLLERNSRPAAERWRDAIEDRRQMSARKPRRYPTIQAAIERMRAENPDLSDEQITHLTIHAVSRDEDDGFSWKFDPYVRQGWPVDIAAADLEALWRRIECPVLLPWGLKSWVGDPEQNGFAGMFRDARSVAFDAGHWLHHDRFDQFMAELRDFL